MKVIFLDIDGVLNVIPEGRDEFGSLFHPHFVVNLKEIIEKTGAKIVMSSTWRMAGLTKVQTMWQIRDLPGEIIDITPCCSQLMRKNNLQHYDNIERGHEIQDWLDQNQVDSYCIIDDDKDMLPDQLPFFVRTDHNKKHSDHVEGYGLTKECSEKVINILNSASY